jgi:hypothetical protein
MHRYKLKKATTRNHHAVPSVDLVAANDVDLLASLRRLFADRQHHAAEAGALPAYD